jgi:hypothetical protein
VRHAEECSDWNEADASAWSVWPLVTKVQSILMAISELDRKNLLYLSDTDGGCKY